MNLDQRQPQHPQQQLQPPPPQRYGFKTGLISCEIFKIYLYEQLLLV